MDLGFASMTNWNDTVVLPSYFHTSENGNNVNGEDLNAESKAYFYKGNTASLEYPIPITFEDFTRIGINAFRFGVGPFKNYQ